MNMLRLGQVVGVEKGGVLARAELLYQIFATQPSIVARCEGTKSTRSSNLQGIVKLMRGTADSRIWILPVLCSLTTMYARHRFPTEIISYAVWLYFAFPSLQGRAKTATVPGD